MATVQVKARTPINVLRLSMWPMLDEEEETYGDVIDFDKRFMTYTDNIASNSASLFGCGVVVDSVVALGQGSLSYGIHAFTADERTKVFGETKKTGGAVVTTGNEVIPYVAAAHMEAMSNGHVNLFKYFKAKFPPNEMSTQQISDGNITYSTQVINGTYVRSEEQDAMRAIYYDVNPKTEDGKALIQKWFTDATYIGEETSSSGSGSGSGTGTGD